MTMSIPITAGLLLILALTLLSGNFVLGQECGENGMCDSHERCNVWAKEGLCIQESRYMQKHCPLSCSLPDKSSTGEECVDRHPKCKLFASAGECRSENSNQMRKFCPNSCKTCGNTEAERESCRDINEECSLWASRGNCEKDGTFMKKTCPKSCNFCSPVKERVTASAPTLVAEQELLDATEDFGKRQEASGKEMLNTMQIIKKSIAYMESEATELPVEVLEKCFNRNKLCSFWSAIGECESNQAYMVTHCAPACQTCNLIDMESRCPPLEDPHPALVPGALRKMFENIIETAPGNHSLSPEERQGFEEAKIPEYTVNVVSRPPVGGMDTRPWVVVFDNFTTAEECQHLIDLGHKVGYERSRDVGEQKFDGTFDGKESDGRTSENAWCSARNNCRTDEVVQRIQNRMGIVMDIEPDHSEDLQLLKYTEGQFYRRHHDFIPHHVSRQCGPRILTFFLYLSDVEGGGTRFHDINKVVEPKMGRAVLWPSVLDRDPLQKDSRTHHEAEPVKAGTKYAANGWIHLYDYVAASKRGCT